MLRQKETLFFSLILALVLIVFGFIGKPNDYPASQLFLEESGKRMESTFQKDIIGKIYPLFPKDPIENIQTTIKPQTETPSLKETKDEQNQTISNQEDNETKTNTNSETEIHSFFYLINNQNNDSIEAEDKETEYIECTDGCTAGDPEPGNDFCEETCAERETKIKNENTQASLFLPFIMFVQTALAFDPCAYCGPCACLCHCCGPQCC